MTVPQSIRNVKSSGILHLQWSDGTLQELAHGILRAKCPCSHCRAAKLRGQIELVNEEVRINEIVNQGYGAQLIFSDGHERGIYPWIYLKQIG